MRLDNFSRDKKQLTTTFTFDEMYAISTALNILNELAPDRPDYKQNEKECNLVTNSVRVLCDLVKIGRLSPHTIDKIYREELQEPLEQKCAPNNKRTK